MTNDNVYQQGLSLLVDLIFIFLSEGMLPHRKWNKCEFNPRILVRKLEITVQQIN